MGLATFAGRPFRIDPHSVSWDFQAKTNVTYTLGGKVIQVFGTSLSDMVVEGAFGVGGWQQQLLFLQQMKDISREQIRAGRTANSDAQPFQFTYSPRGWDFLVYLKAYQSPEGDAVIQSNEMINPKWRLTLFIVEDNSGLKKVAQNAYISRMSEGIGWRQTEFNGPLGDLVLSDATTGSSGTAPPTGQGHGAGNAG